MKGVRKISSPAPPTSAYFGLVILKAQFKFNSNVRFCLETPSPSELLARTFVLDAPLST